jgi:hypothetical protein
MCRYQNYFQKNYLEPNDRDIACPEDFGTVVSVGIVICVSVGVGVGVRVSPVVGEGLKSINAASVIRMIAVCIAAVEIDSAEATSSFFLQDVSRRIVAANRKNFLRDIRDLIFRIVPLQISASRTFG